MWQRSLASPPQAEASARTQVGCGQRKAGSEGASASRTTWKARKCYSHVGSMCPWQQGRWADCWAREVLTFQVGLWCSKTWASLLNRRSSRRTKKPQCRGICGKRQGPEAQAWPVGPNPSQPPPSLTIPSSRTRPDQLPHLGTSRRQGAQEQQVHTALCTHNQPEFTQPCIPTYYGKRAGIGRQSCHQSKTVFLRLKSPRSMVSTVDQYINM